MKVILFIGTVDLLLSTISYIYYRQNFSFAKSWLFAALYLLLAVNTVGSRLLPEATPAFLLKLSAWLGGFWIAFMYYTLLLAVGHGLLYLAGKVLGFALPSAKIAAAGLTFILCFIAWGSFRAFSPTLRTEEITTAKLPADAHYKVVLVSDIHLGRILGRTYSEDLVQKINAQQPDFVLIAGDILDERIAYVKQEDSLAPLANIQAPKGVFAAYGNHDYLDNPQLWQNMLEAAKITVLRDNSLVVDGAIKISGLNDFSRNRSTLTLEQQAAGNDAYYNILIDHQPRKIDAAAAAGYDLYVAGHTHTGQLFPNRLVTKRMYKLDYGRADFGAMTAITSNGYGFWGPPVRTEIKPELIVINLKGK